MLKRHVIDDIETKHNRIAPAAGGDGDGYLRKIINVLSYAVGCRYKEFTITVTRQTSRPIID